MESRKRYPDCPVRGKLKISKFKFWQFFYHFGGKLRQPVTKPRLSEKQIIQRYEFAKKWVKRLESSEKFYYCFVKKENAGSNLISSHFALDENKFSLMVANSV